MLNLDVKEIEKPNLDSRFHLNKNLKRTFSITDQDLITLIKGLDTPRIKRTSKEHPVCPNPTIIKDFNLGKADDK